MDSWPLAEFPTSYILMSAVAMLGACLGRRCWFKDDYRFLWPCLNLLLIGPSGIGKSSSLELARDFLLYNTEERLRPQFIGGASTMEALHEMLVVQPRAIIYCSELAAFFNKTKYMEAVIPYVTELLDYGPQVERNLRGVGKIKVSNPTVTVMGGSTKDWLTEALPNTAVGGGFLPRFLIVKEDEKRQRVPNPGMALSAKGHAAVQDIREGAIATFPDLVANTAGEITWADYSVADAYAEWYNHYQPSTGHMAPFAARAPQHIKRLAMLVAVSSRRDAITEDDLKSSITMYTYVDERLQDVIVPSTPIGKLIAAVLAAIPPNGAKESTIARSCKNIMMAQDVSRHLQGLMASKDVSYDTTKGTFHRT